MLSCRLQPGLGTHVLGFPFRYKTDPGHHFPFNQTQFYIQGGSFCKVTKKWLGRMFLLYVGGRKCVFDKNLLQNVGQDIESKPR